MPSIARYTQQIGVLRNLPQSVPGPEAFGAAIGQSLNRIGEQRMQEEEQAQELDDKLYLMKAASDFELQLSDAERQAKDQMSPDGSGHVENMSKIFDQASANFRSGAQARGSRATYLAETMLANYRGNFLSRAQGDQTARLQDWRGGQILDTINNFTQAAGLGDTRAIANIDRTFQVAGLVMGASWVAEKRPTAISNAHIGIIKSLAAKDPSAAMAYYNTNKAAIQSEKYDELDTYIDKAEQPFRVAAGIDQARKTVATGGSGGDAPGGGGAATAQQRDNAVTFAGIAEKNGADPLLSATILGVESSWGTDSKAKNGTQLLDNPDATPEQQAQEIARRAALAKKFLGRDPENWEVYAYWQQGEGGGPALLKADPNAKAIDVLRQVYDNPKKAESAIVDNGGNLDMTVGEFRDVIRSTYEKRETETRRMLEGGGDAGSGGGATKSEPTLMDMIAALPEDMSPEDREVAIRQLKEDFSLIEGERKAQQKELEGKAWAFVLDGGNPDKLPVEVLQGLGPDYLKKLQGYYDDRLKGVEVKTDSATWSELFRMSTREPEKFASLDLNQYVIDGTLSLSDMKQFAERQAEIEKGDGHEVTLRNIGQMVDGAIVNLGIDTKGIDGKKQAEKIERFVQDQLIAFQRANKRPATPEEQQAIVDKAIMVAIPEQDNFDFGTDLRNDPEKLRYELTIDDVPEEDQAGFRDALTRVEQPVNDQAIIDLWLLKLARKKGQ